MLTAFLSFLGVVIGASLQYYFTRHIENQRHIRDLRSKAYMDYLLSVAEQAQFRYTNNSPERIKLNTKTADAKSRICLYGSSKVIQVFSEFQQLGAIMNTKEQRKAFTDMVQAMRSDSGAEPGVVSDDLQNVLLGFSDK